MSTKTDEFKIVSVDVEFPPYEMTQAEKVQSNIKCLISKGKEDNPSFTPIKEFSFDNKSEKFRQDKVVIPMCAPFIELPGEYRLAHCIAKDFTVVAAHENERAQVFSETAKSSIRTIQLKPNRYSRKSSRFIVKCDSYSIDKDNVLTLNGNVQITEGATRAAALHEMQNDPKHTYDENLAKAYVSFIIILRSDDTDEETAKDEISANSSKKVGEFEKVANFGTFDALVASMGEYAPLMRNTEILPYSEDLNKKYYLKPFIDSLLTLDACTLHSELSGATDLKEYGVRSSLDSFCKRTLHAIDINANEDVLHSLDYMKPIAREGVRLIEFLMFEFLPMVYANFDCDKDEESFKNFKVLVTGSGRPKQYNNIELIGSNLGRKNEQKVYRQFNWNYTALRMILNGARCFIREKEVNGHSEMYFIVDPIEVLSNRAFQNAILTPLFCALTINSEKGKKASSIEPRNNTAARVIYQNFKLALKEYQERNNLNN